jgi:hypothetical protein
MSTSAGVKSWLTNPYLRSEVFVALPLKVPDFWDVMLCSLENCL